MPASGSPGPAECSRATSVPDVWPGVVWMNPRWPTDILTCNGQNECSLFCPNEEEDDLEREFQFKCGSVNQEQEYRTFYFFWANNSRAWLTAQKRNENRSILKSEESTSPGATNIEDSILRGRVVFFFFFFCLFQHSPNSMPKLAFSMLGRR